MNLGPNFLFDEVVQPVFIVRDPSGELLVHYFPMIAFLFLHFKHDPIATIVGHINMEQVVGVAGKEPEIKFPQAVGCLYQLGEVDVSCEGEIHMSSLWVPNVQWSCFICLRKS